MADPLGKLGYVYKGTAILQDRHYFLKGEPRMHQIHLYEIGSKYLLEQLAFRDRLRESKEIRNEYERLKFSLAHANKHDKHKYAEEKTAFIQSILKNSMKDMKTS